MKRKLLLLFVCLFGALGGVKAWTSVTPTAGNTYYLYNTTRGNYFQANTTGPYDLISDIAYATPVTMITGSESGKYYLEFKVGGTSYRLCHSAGTPQLTDWGHNYTISGTDNDGYEIKSHVKDKSNQSARDRWFSAWDSFHCNFPDNKNENAYKWKFVSVEDALVGSGWEKVTGIESLKNQPENYLYAILSANNSSLIVRTDASTGHGYYRSMCAPLSSSEYLFSIENYIYDSKDYFVMKAENTNAYYHAENNAAYDLVAKNKSTVDSDCRLEFEYADNAWNIKTWTSYSGDPTCGSYWGLWDYNQGYADGKKMAGNKNENEKGSFLIYRIPKYNLDMTGRIYNHSFELDNVSDSKRVGAKGWTLPQTDGDTKVQLNSNETYTMTTVDGSQLFNTWNGDATGYTISQTISNLPAGQYKVSAVMASFENKTLQLKANDATGTAPSVNKGTGVEVNTYVTLENPGDIAISAKTAAGAFYKVDNFRLTYYGTPATSADYTALQEAINDAEAKTLGFDYEEYAPYNNVAALNALAEAKAIDQSANNQQMLVQEATNALTSKSWTANSGNVDAVFNGLFSSSEDWGLTGWTRTNAWGQQQTGLEGDYATAYYNQPGSLVYGSTDNYSMPLNADQVYKLTFAYRSHESGSNNSVTASINKKGGSAVFSKQYGANPSTTEWRVVTAFFTTQAAGDYVLTLANSGNTWMTGVSIEKLPSTVPATIGENGYTTFASAYPLDLTQANLPVGVKAYKATSINSSYIHFEKLNQVVPANTGVLLEGAAGSHNIRVGSEVEEATGNLFLVNESNDTFSPEANTTYYAMVKNSDPMTFGKFDPNVVAVPNYKAYLKVSGGSQARLTVMFDGEDPTAINAIEAAEAEEGALKDGKYLIGGKIVIVKNGVKYSANGQKLN